MGGIKIRPYKERKMGKNMLMEYRVWLVFLAPSPGNRNLKIRGGIHY
jgi:hypothetical protein